MSKEDMTVPKDWPHYIRVSRGNGEYVDIDVTGKSADEIREIIKVVSTEDLSNIPEKRTFKL